MSRIFRGAVLRHSRTLLEIVPYSAAHHDAVERLNAKLAEAGSEWTFPPVERPADAEDLPAWDESFVAVDGSEVYGGYILKHRRYLLADDPLDLGALQLPLSLGEVDNAFAHVSVALLFDAMRRSPYLYSLGLGSDDTQYARLLAAAGWEHLSVPFFFAVKSPDRFARQIRLPADMAGVQRVLRLLGHSRLAAAAFALRRRAARRSHYGSALDEAVEVRELTDLDRLADDVFAADASSYVLVGDRGAQTLRRLYPTDGNRFHRLAVTREERVVGWAVVLDTQMRDNKYFGDMRVGSIADCFAAPDDAPLVVAAADAFLTRRGVDVVVTNQLHPRWCDALQMTGYERGPSNFFFYFSEELAERLRGVPDWQRGAHLNRGDGEGPEHL